MTDLDKYLAEVEERAKRATDGPWEYDQAIEPDDGQGTHAIYARPSEHHVLEIIETPDELGGQCIHQGANDANFIAHARTDIPRLVALCRRLNKEVEVLRGGMSNIIGLKQRKYGDNDEWVGINAFGLADTALATADKIREGE